MHAEKLSERVRRKLTDLLAEDRPDAERFMTTLRELRDLEQVRAHAAVLNMLAHIQVPEPQAERLLRDLFRHRDEVTNALGRDPGLRVAAVDYLSNVKKLLSNPTIVESEQLEKTERSAITDSLTGLYNRRHFVERLQLEVRRCRRYRQRLSLLILDIDGFKAMNDLHGHLFGDLVLQRVGRILRGAVREADVACRYGGEEFAVVLPETERIGAFVVAERIRSSVQAGFTGKPIGGKIAPLTISGGVASYPEDGTDGKSLIARGDEALYQSKRLGKNRVSLYHTERRQAIRYPARESARIELLLDDRHDPFHVMPLDLSLLGALFEVGESCRTGQSVQVTFDGRDPDDRPQKWILIGQVVRVDAGRNGERVAVSFERPMSEECLAQQIRPTIRLRSAQGGRV